MQQIYVEEVYNLNGDGSFGELVNASSGAIVKLDDCEYIEFLEVKEESSPVHRSMKQNNLRYKILHLLGLDRGFVAILEAELTSHSEASAT